MNLKKLIDDSLEVTTKTLVGWPKMGCRNKPLDMREVARKNNERYSVHKDVMCFVHMGRVFVTPFTRKRVLALEAAGLKPGKFYVPFSNGDYPVHERKQWEKMRLEAHGANFRDYERICARHAEKVGICSLSRDTLQRCFRIPFGGVAVKFPGNGKGRVYPACKELDVDSVVLLKIGTYSENKGLVAFVYRDGHTYVGRGHKLVDELKRAGFREEYLSVPFSHGEVVIDPAWADRLRRL